GHNSGCLGGIIFVKGYAKDHLQGKEKQDKRSRDRKGIYIYTNKVEDLFSHKKKNDHQYSGNYRCFFTLNMSGLFPEVNNNGNTSNNINHCKKDHTCSPYFANIQ